jgi:hypothetical protein
MEILDHRSSLGCVASPRQRKRDGAQTERRRSLLLRLQRSAKLHVPQRGMHSPTRRSLWGSTLKRRVGCPVGEIARIPQTSVEGFGIRLAQEKEILV